MAGRSCRFRRCLSMPRRFRRKVVCHSKEEEKVEEIIEASPVRVALSYSCSQEPSFKQSVVDMRNQLKHYCTRLCAIMVMALFGLTAGLALQASVTVTPAQAEVDCNHSLCDVEESKGELYCKFSPASHCGFDGSGNCYESGCS